MCTLSFIPTRNGHYAAMNRDERLTRQVAQVPELLRVGDTWAVYPHEENGGTWIAGNEYGTTLAVLNWNLSEGQQPVEKERSRGELIPQLIAHADLSEVASKLDSLVLDGVLPFRMVGIFGHQRQLCEWRWDGARLRHKLLPWQSGHWFSSGISDDLAARERGQACQLAWQAADAGTLPWLRELHRSHSPLPGAFSICVHRPDAATVSYSEIACDGPELTFRYRPGHPCRVREAPVVLKVPLASRDLAVV
jgi:Transport and Golgi organisation 2